jgi:hypothetical protein
MSRVREARGGALYEAYWRRNGWDSPTPFAQQAHAIREMWMGIADDIPLAARAGKMALQEDVEDVALLADANSNYSAAQLEEMDR